jgi:hypothetical protein
VRCEEGFDFVFLDVEDGHSRAEDDRHAPHDAEDDHSDAGYLERHLHLKRSNRRLCPDYSFILDLNMSCSLMVMMIL